MNFDIRKAPRDQQVALYVTALCITKISDMRFREDILEKNAIHHVNRCQQIGRAYDRMNESSRAFAKAELDNEREKAESYRSSLKSIKADINRESRRLDWAHKRLQKDFELLKAPYQMNSSSQLQEAFQIQLTFGAILHNDGMKMIQEMDEDYSELVSRNRPIPDYNPK